METWAVSLIKWRTTTMTILDFFTKKAAIEDALYKFAELNIEKSKMAGAYLTLEEFDLCGVEDNRHISATFRQCFQNNDYETHTFRLPLDFFEGMG
jgi:hypothetical protein